MKIVNIILAAAGPVAALSGKATTTVSPNLPFYNRAPALTVETPRQRYYDGQKGACGCCPASGNSAFSWQAGISSGVYTAAASPAIFGGSSTWCGSGCGTCFKLTSTGSAPCSGCGTGGASGQSIIVMVTNLCPHAGNEQWCPNAG